MIQSLDQIHSLGIEIAAMNNKMDFLNSDRLEKATQIQNRISANQQLSAEIRRTAASSSTSRGHNEVKLIDTKSMGPKKFDGKADSPFRAWAKAVRTYCNASKPGFRKYLRWIESQTQEIDGRLLMGFTWEHKEAASDALYDFLLAHTTDDAKRLVELQPDENGPEAWRQLSLRYDPIGESYVFDTIGSLMKVPRCKQLTDLPAALTNWERAQNTFYERTGGQAIPQEWKLPILFDIIPASILSEIKIKHKYTQGFDKTYEGFSKLLIEMAHEKHYDRRAAKGRGESDMDVDALAAEKAENQAAENEDYDENREYTEAEWLDWESHLQEELNWLGARNKGGKSGKGGKGRKGDRRKGKGKGREGGGGKGKGEGCTWCGDLDHWRADCEKLKKHKVDMDADRKKKGLPAFVPRPRGVNSLDPEERRKVADDNDEDYEVTGLMCDSDGDCDCIEIGDFLNERF